MIQLWNQIGDQWTRIMLPLVWQGAIAVTLIWTLTKVWPSLPAAKRHWLWRLVYLKLLVLACWQSPISLPLLPAKESTQNALISGNQTPAHSPFPSASNPRTVFSPIPSRAESQSTNNDLKADESIQAFPSPAPKFSAWLALLWFIGLLGFAARVAKAYHATSRIARESATLFGTPLYDLFIDLSRQAQLKRTPRLVSHPSISSPLVVGCFKPCIIIPESYRDAPISNDTKLILLHELSHIGRRDLWWGWLRVIIESLTFFHPMVWIARRQWNLTQEMACDEAVVNRAQVTAPAYQQALLRTLEQGRKQTQISNSLLAVGASGSFRDMKERMIAMNQIQSRSPFYQLTATCLVVAIGFAGVLPYQLVAKSKKNKQTEASESSIVDDLGVTSENSFREKDFTVDPAVDADDQVGIPGEETVSEPTLSPVIQGLAAALKSEQPEVRKRVVEALSELEDPAAIPVLIRALQDPASDVRHEALHGLEEFDDPRALNAVVKLLQSDSWKTRNQALDALEDFAHPNAAHSIIQALDDPHPKNRIKALDALEEFHHPDIVGAVKKSLQDGNWQVRREAAELLGESRSPEALNSLVHALADSHRAVRDEAFDALQELELENLPDHIGSLLREHPDEFRPHADYFFERFNEQQLEEAERHQRDFERRTEREAERKQRELARKSEKEAHRQMEIAREQAEKAHKEIQEAFAAQHKHSKLWPDKVVTPRNQSPQFNSHPRPEPTPMDLDRIVQSVLSQVNAKVEEAVAKALSELERKKQKQEKSGFDPFENETEEQGNSL